MGLFSLAFYNTENLFDPYNNQNKHDGDFTPNGARKWTEKRYYHKIKKIGQAIHIIGQNEIGQPPLIVGLAEVENKKVLKDLVRSEFLEEYNYRYVHFESLDERGVDTALIYRSEHIELVNQEIIRSAFPGDFTRDVLYVEFLFQQRKLHVLVVHLPSRRDIDVNRSFRNIILNEIRGEIKHILAKDPNANIVVMGDFNGNPDDEDARKILKTQATSNILPDELYNPMLNLKKCRGSLIHDGKWILFDQILFSQSFFQSSRNSFQIDKVDVFKDRMLQDWNGKYAGTPFRTYAGNKYLGGYSDHFPVYAILNY